MSEENQVNLRFAGGEADVADLKEEISSVLQQLADPASDVARAAAAAGLNAADMAGAQASVEKDAKGFGFVVILVAISVPVAAHIVNKFWDDVIWPHIKDRLGADALGKREE